MFIFNLTASPQGNKHRNCRCAPIICAGACSRRLLLPAANYLAAGDKPPPYWRGQLHAAYCRMRQDPLALPLGELSAKLTERAGHGGMRRAIRESPLHAVVYLISVGDGFPVPPGTRRINCIASGYPSRDYPIRGYAAHGHKQNLPDETSGVLLIEPRRTHPTSTHTKNPPRMGWVFVWRRRRDSNPRDPFEVYAISNRARSTKLRDFSTVPP